jgi:Fe-S cluster assembly protein SufD
VDAKSNYLALEKPDRSNHLWRYTPWRRVHPTGKIEEIPDLGNPTLRLGMLDSGRLPNGVRIVKGSTNSSGLPMMDEVTSNFLAAASTESQYTLEIDKDFSSETPVLLEIETGNEPSILHICLKVGENANLELVTKLVGSSEWFGLMRSGNVGRGAMVNDVFVSLKDSGTVLRSDSIGIGRDAQVKAGTISSGSERTKADLRYRLGERGGNLKVLGSVMSTHKMHLDHHIEIQHDAPETFSRLSWHSACGGNSRTVGTGMLRVAEGSKGADAAQIFHNLLLSKKAEADSIPELEVMENEVVGCGHGTANGPIDEDQLFYLEARGFDRKEARSALIAAFLNSPLSEMGSRFLHNWLVGILTDELEDLEAVN